MDIRYSVNQRDIKRYTTEELRAEFLIDTLFKPGATSFTYSHIDRVVTMSAMPLEKALNLEDGLDVWKALGAKFFLERRELGIINIGGGGVVKADGKEYALERIEALYLGMGTKEVVFSAVDAKNPPKFYIVSSPAHKPCASRLVPFKDAIHRDLGSLETSNARTINQFIHPDVLETCQLSMGVTILKPGSVWNTMPSHTHERRMEVYLYFDIPKDNVVFHYMGEPTQTRHIVMQNEQAVLSPSYSIHSGCGTANYSFIWAMAGENKVFDDMDGIPTTELR